MAHRFHPDHDTLLGLLKIRDAQLRDYNPSNPAIGTPPYDYRILESLLIFSRYGALALHYVQTPSDEVLGARKSKLAMGVGSVRMVTAYMMVV